MMVEAMFNNSIEKIQHCEICKTYKPPRSHHCKRCERCFLKYDHHCAFLDICIGFHNYKFFYQFLVTNFITIAYFLLVLALDLVFRKVYPNYLIINFSIAMFLYFIEGAVNLSFIDFTH